MHDFRIKAEGARVRTTRQTKADNTIKDTFYWPDMTVHILFHFSTTVFTNIIQQNIFFLVLERSAKILVVTWTLKVCLTPTSAT